MTKKLLITLSIFALFASCNVLRRTNPATHDEGVIINGIRWATRNVDAPGTFAETPESPGMFFQWNRRKGWSAVDEEVEGWDNSIPESTKWYAENDPCPEGWRVPTKNELRYLYDAGSVWATSNDVSGRLFGTAPNQIFLPASGIRDNNCGTLVAINSWGAYWSSTQNDDIMWTWASWVLFFDKDYAFVMGRSPQANGQSIRCVAK